jgi:peptidyl-prolyl cis-trans isomerase C
MTGVSVNGIAVDPMPGEPVELAAARELLRQRAVALGLLAKDEDDDETDSAGI